MESLFWEKQMKRRLLFFVLLVSIFWCSFVFGQKSQHFYNVDKEVKVEGTIQKIIMEPRYKNTAPFLIVALKKKNTNQIYQVEVSPIWFFEYDFHKGEKLVVTGSLYIDGQKNQNIIAREIRFRGEFLLLRDKHGFPNWRGGRMKKRVRRKGGDF